jgi:drug/metabolite transporter (DMT)-like permease
MSRRSGILLMIVSATSFGVMPILARFAYASGTEPFTLLFLRFTAATPIMIALCAISGARIPRGKSLAALILLGAVLYVAQALCYFMALTIAPASLVALLLYLYPGLVAIGASVLSRERFTLTKAMALGLALLGAALMIGFVRGGSVAGILLGIGASVVYSVYILVGDSVMKKVDPLPATTIVIASTAVVYAAIALARGPVWPSTGAGWMAIGALSVVSTVIAIGTFFAGLERIGPTNASTISALEPAIAVVLAALLLGEAITPLKAAGAVLILAAVLLIARAGSRDLGSAAASRRGAGSSAHGAP